KENGARHERQLPNPGQVERGWLSERATGHDSCDVGLLIAPDARGHCGAPYPASAATGSFETNRTGLYGLAQGGKPAPVAQSGNVVLGLAAARERAVQFTSREGSASARPEWSRRAS